LTRSRGAITVFATQPAIPPEIKDLRTYSGDFLLIFGDGGDDTVGFDDSLGIDVVIAFCIGIEGVGMPVLLFVPSILFFTSNGFGNVTQG
jgi:hypothetical protein